MGSEPGAGGLRHALSLEEFCDRAKRPRFDVGAAQDQPDKAECPFASDVWHSVASAWRYTWNNLRFLLWRLAGATFLGPVMQGTCIEPRSRQVLSGDVSELRLGNSARQPSSPTPAHTAGGLLLAVQAAGGVSNLCSF